MTVDGHGRRLHRAVLGHAGDGPGHRDHATRSSRSTCSACRSSRSASCRATPTAATASAAPARARCSPAARRCGSAPERTVEQAQAAGRRGARGGGGRHRVRAPGASASPAPTCGIGLFELAGSSRSGSICRRLDQRRSRPDAGPTAATSARSRSTPTPARSRSSRYASVNDVGRVVNPMIVRGQLDGGAVQGIGQALCEHVVYDARDRPAADRQLHGLRDAARRHASRDFTTRVRRVDAVPDQPAGRQGRRRARHHRRDAGGGQCGGRRARARRPRRAPPSSCRCR